ncbi:MAG: HisA/HisF-related TIM barrel protein [Pyrobaculum sp.]
MIIPSIDIEGGRAVKRILGERGRYIYTGDPLELAKKFRKAPLVHVVDLDGAEAGRPVNIGVVQSVAALLEGRCQLGGGLRSVEWIEWALSICKYAVVGSLPFKSPGVFKEAVERFGKRLVVSLDVKGGRAVVSGWREASATVTDAVEILKRHAPYAALVVTVVEVEGTGGGVAEVDTKPLRDLADRLYYAGGVKDCRDVEKALALGFDGVIVGYALYKGDLSQCVKDIW